MTHRRVTPEHHQFSNQVSLVWIDPDNPALLCDLHPAWSHRRPAPARFRRSDYGVEPDGSLAEAARQDLADPLGYKPGGPVRMLSQIRRWGWLFNPITIFLVWDDLRPLSAARSNPVGVVLEVTNTPWKERIRYPLPLVETGGRLVAEFDKAMHVSPFLGMDHRYELSVVDQDDRLAIDLDVVDHDGIPVLHTALRLDREPATRQTLAKSLRSQRFPTHRVSAGIHIQAARLWAKGVPFVGHPKKSSSPVSEKSRIKESR